MNYPPRTTIYVDVDGTLLGYDGTPNRWLENQILECGHPFVIWSNRDTHNLRMIVEEHFPRLAERALAILQKPAFAIDDAPWRILPEKRWKKSTDNFPYTEEQPPERVEELT